jgi:hypothetical protein
MTGYDPQLLATLLAVEQTGSLPARRRAWASSSRP